MSYNLTYVHVVIATRHRKRVLTRPIRKVLFKTLITKCTEYSIGYMYLNGVEDHVHVLLSLQGTQNVSELVRKIKGYSSWWLNRNVDELQGSFNWSKGYYADGVSRKQAPMVREYITKQEDHHSKPGFKEIWEKILDS